MTRILVTGGAGFIGSNFLRYWSTRHPRDTIVCVDNLTYAGNLESIRELVTKRRVRFVRADVANLPLMVRLLRGTDQVVHFAAESHVDRSIRRAIPFVHSNVLGTVSLLEAARRCGVQRFHHVSTDEVYGTLSLTSRVRFTPGSAYMPRSPYAASKAAADHFARAYFHTHSLPVTISNCGNNYGPFQHPEKFIPKCVTHAISNLTIPIYGDGRNVRDWIHVMDHCSAIERILVGGKVGETYLVGANNEHSNREIAFQILKMIPDSESELEFVPDRPGHDRRYALDTRKLRNQLNWKPIVPFNAGLRQTINWYRTHVPWWRRAVLHSSDRQGNRIPQEDAPLPSAREGSE